MDDNVQRCQSCGMRLAEGFYGTAIDGSVASEYCSFCFQNGAFVNPDQTVDEMIESSVQNMTHELKMPEDKAKELATAVIPHLKRWNKAS